MTRPNPIPAEDRELLIEEAMLELSRQSGAPIRDDDTIRALDDRLIDMGLIVDAILEKAEELRLLREAGPG